jgi:hypothetical protein
MYEFENVLLPLLVAMPGYNSICNMEIDGNTIYVRPRQAERRTEALNIVSLVVAMTMPHMRVLLTN